MSHTKYMKTIWIKPVNGIWAVGIGDKVILYAATLFIARQVKLRLLGF